MVIPDDLSAPDDVLHTRVANARLLALPRQGRDGRFPREPHLSVKSSVGAACGAQAVGGAPRGVGPAGGTEMGGGGGLREGPTQEETFVPLFQSPSKVPLEPEKEPG